VLFPSSIRIFDWLARVSQSLLFVPMNTTGAIWEGRKTFSKQPRTSHSGKYCCSVRFRALRDWTAEGGCPYLSREDQFP
jgi:hypothetical protein